MIDEIDLTIYQDVIGALLKWKVIPVNLLKKEINYTGRATSFRKLMQRLEQRNLLKSFKIRGRTKFAYPSEELIKVKAHRVSYGFYEDSLKHEGVVTVVCFELLNWKVMKNVFLSHEFGNQQFNREELQPDAIFVAEKDGHEFRIALEVELTRKSKERVKKKFINYVDSIAFHYVIYLMSDKADYEAYKRILIDIANDDTVDDRRFEILTNVILVFKDNFFTKEMNLQKAEAFWQGETTTLDLILEERKS